MRTVFILIIAILYVFSATSQTADEYINRGNAKGRLQDYRGSITDYNKAIELNPNYAEAYFNRGLAKFYLDQKDSGCLDLSKAGELGYNSYDAIREFCY